MSYTRNNMNVFKYGEFVKIAGINMYVTAGGDPDIISRHIRSNVSFDWEKDVFESSLTHSRSIYGYGWRASVDIDIDVVSSDLINKVRDMLEALDSTKEECTIIIDYYDDDSNSITYNGMYLDSSISPKDISNSLRLGETLSLNFKSKSLRSALPILEEDVTVIGDSSDNVIGDSGDNVISSIN